MNAPDFTFLSTAEYKGIRVALRSETGDVRHYELLDFVGSGKRGITWKAVDGIAHQWAIKFVSQSDYHNHSLQAEAVRVNTLKSDLIARIDFYGVPDFADRPTPPFPLYGVVVEWVEGKCLEDYLKDPDTKLDVPMFLRFARSLLEAIADLSAHELSHNDLHGRNVLVTPLRDSLSGAASLGLKLIDTGSLKTESRRLSLIDEWQAQASTLQTAATESSADLSASIQRLTRWITWFNRTDQEWVVSHLCELHNALLRALPEATPATKRFLELLPDSLDLMDDHDPSRRLSDPRRMYAELERIWHKATELVDSAIASPFDLMSAELFRSPKQLMDLFSEEFPGLGECRSNDPVYIYGPRGCGKSTILRSVSLQAVLATKNVERALEQIPFVGVYISCSTELRSRFWLMPDADYDVLEAHIVRYFGFLLIEELLNTFALMAQWDEQSQSFRFGVTEDISGQMCRCIQQRLSLPPTAAAIRGTSPFTLLSLQLRQERDRLWERILDRNEPSSRTDAQLIFDICKDLSDICSLLKTRRVAFLIDDYSNQRIPLALQRKLNQAITFAKQGTPIFKVTSEYGGVDLAGIEEGREVREVNVGSRYVDLTDRKRWQFLKDVLEKRFDYLNVRTNFESILPLSGIGPAVPMAIAIKTAFKDGRPFYYHGLDTIGDLCSGDLAMGLDLVRKIFEEARMDWRSPRPISAETQHKAVERYASLELNHIRYLSPDGRKKYHIMERLCWLAKECVLNRVTTKEGREIPSIRIHIDISEAAFAGLEQSSEDLFELLTDLIRRGALFPLDTSKSRDEHQGTRRFQIRRVLLPRYGAPLGRHTPIRIDRLEDLRFLLTEPKDFVKAQLETQGMLIAEGSD